MRIAVLTSAAMLLTSCAYRPDPVPIAGSPSAIGSMAGTWLGEYSGSESGRSGSITFIISARGDSAFGDVLMVSSTNAGVLQPVHSPQEHMAHVRSSQALRIDFVAVSEGELSSNLEPYIAPDCNCQVRTTFTGRRNGNVIEGTFVTRGPSTFEQHGTWRVSRSR